MFFSDNLISATNIGFVHGSIQSEVREIHQGYEVLNSRAAHMADIENIDKRIQFIQQELSEALAAGRANGRRIAKLREILANLTGTRSRVR